MAFIRTHKIEIGIFALALIVRLLFFWLGLAAHGGDLVNTINAGDGYYEIAQNIIAGHGYSAAQEPPYALTSYRTPGMPYFIVALQFLFGTSLAVIMAHIVLGSIVPLLGMSIARYLTEKRAIAVMTGVFLALEPTGVMFSTVLLSETVFTFFFLLSLLYLFRAIRDQALAPLCLSAFLLGMSTLVRPPVEYLPVVIIALLLWKARARLSRAAFLHAGLYALIFLLTLSPWLYRNYRAFGVFGLSSQQGAALYAVMVPSVLAIERGTNVSQEFNTDIAGPNETDFAQSAEYTKRAVPVLLSHPRALALLGAHTAFSFFTYDGVYDFLRRINLDGDMFTILSQAKQENGIPIGTPVLLSLFSAPVAVLQYLAAAAASPLAFVLISRVFWLLITLAFLFSVWRAVREKPQSLFALIAVCVVIYLMLTTLIVGYTVNYRYRLPVNALIFTLAASEAVLAAAWFRRIFNASRAR